MNGSLIFGAVFLDDVITWLAHRFSLVDVTMWGIQFVGTISERILLFLACSMAVTAIEHARNRSILSEIVPTNWIPHMVTSTRENLWASQVITSSKNTAPKIRLPFIGFSSVPNW